MYRAGGGVADGRIRRRQAKFGIRLHLRGPPFHPPKEAGVVDDGQEELARFEDAFTSPTILYCAPTGFALSRRQGMVDGGCTARFTCPSSDKRRCTASDKTSRPTSCSPTEKGSRLNADVAGVSTSGGVDASCDYSAH